MVGVVQRLEHWTVAPGVGGSNPLAHPNFSLKVNELAVGPPRDVLVVTISTFLSY
jgi:hypothetical protein